MKTFLDKTIASIMSLRNSPEGEIGVEIEMEGNPKVKSFGDWGRKQDGSLRGGGAAEYVLQQPVSPSYAVRVVKDLYQRISDSGGTINDSMRAGVHIHMNFCQSTAKEVLTFLALYYSLEECIVDLCGEERAGNLFCLRMIDADYVNQILFTMSRSKDYRSLLAGNDGIRYAAMNLSSLGKFGSLEFRAVRTPQSPEPIFQMIKLLFKLKKAAKNYRNPTEVLNSMSADGIETVVRNTLGNQAELILEQDNYEEKIEKGLRNIQFWVYANEWEQN